MTPGTRKVSQAISVDCPRASGAPGADDLQAAREVPHGLKVNGPRAVPHAADWAPLARHGVRPSVARCVATRGVAVQRGFAARGAVAL